MVVLPLTGYVSSSDMDKQFYSGTEQGANKFTETLGDLAVYIG
jgi:hypothetical protein